MRENFVLYALCDFEPVKRFEIRSNMIVFGCFSDSTSSRVENKLQSVGLLAVEI